MFRHLQSHSEKGSVAPFCGRGNRTTFLTQFQIYQNINDIPAQQESIVVAIGNFDGCHAGHRRVLATAASLAKSQGKRALMMTFEPHPSDVFAPKPFLFRLTDGRQKARIAEALGLDGIVLMPFDKQTAAVSAEDFVDKILIEKLNVRSVVVGEDFHFGKARLGTPEFLAHAGTSRGFEVHQLNLLQDKGTQVSSTRIRKALSSGKLAEANQLLGYHWIVEGIVVVGDQRGRELGYPTANFVLPDNSNLAQGVYAVKVRLGDEILDGVASFGKPMFDNSQPPFEAHIFDFDRDIYGKRLEVALVSHIRGQMTFAGLDELITQMDADSMTARKDLAAAKPLSELDRQLGFITKG